MELKWIRRDFSGESPIRETLLQKLLERSAGISEIPDQCDEWIAAAGVNAGEQSAMERDFLKKED